MQCIKIDVTYNCIKFKQNENGNIVNFVFYGKTRMECNDNLVAPKKQNNDDAKTNKNTLNTLIILNYVHTNRKRHLNKQDRVFKF